MRVSVSLHGQMDSGKWAFSLVGGWGNGGRKVSRVNEPREREREREEQAADTRIPCVFYSTGILQLTRRNRSWSQHTDRRRMETTLGALDMAWEVARTRWFDFWRKFKWHINRHTYNHLSVPTVCESVVVVVVFFFFFFFVVVVVNRKTRGKPLTAGAMEDRESRREREKAEGESEEKWREKNQWTREREREKNAKNSHPSPRQKGLSSRDFWKGERERRKRLA